ncbi:MAG: hypothetical protein JXK94_09305 [Deltaproteobacteria bacterium]|nr:hypothetical protein [Deltaproteobacteria bacterium]
MTKTPIGTSVESGELCPESGEWAPEHYPDKTKSFKKGDKFPPYKWMSVNWILAKYADE